MEGKTITATVSSKGQITIPQEIREILGISEKGDIVGFQIEKNSILVKKLELIEPEEKFSKEEWKKLAHLARQKGKVYNSGKKFLKALGKL